MDKTSVSVVVVTYNNQRQIDRFLRSIFASDYKGDLEVLLWDNDSKDETRAKVLVHKKRVKYTFSKTNLGFARAVNKLIHKSKGEFILLLNPDCVVKKNTVSRLVDFCSKVDGTAIVSPKLIDPDGKTQASVFKFPTIGNAIRKYFFRQNNAFGKYSPGDKTVKVEVAVMAAMLIPRQVIDKIGALDERFFLYYEDVEFCRRLMENGYDLIYYPKAVVVHEHGASGKFTSHHNSPLLKSSYIYYGQTYARVLHFVLRLGQIWEKRVLQKFS